MNYNLILSLLFIVIVSIDIGECLLDGNETVENNFRHQVYLRNRAFPPCSGVILDEWHIITAAHCVHRNQPAELLVAAGSDELRRGIVAIHAVHEIHVHRDFEYSHDPLPGGGSQILTHDSSNDIAILTLETPLLLGEHSQQVILPSDSLNIQPCAFIPCQMAGWGVYNGHEGEPHLRLMWTPVAIVSSVHCLTSGMALYSNELCVIDVWGNLNMNHFDHGAGLMCNGILVGIIVTSQRPFVATDVYHFMPFIDEVKQKDEALYSSFFPGFAQLNL